jgi:branched-chain amino acid transport system substrate-binding protein
LKIGWIGTESTAAGVTSKQGSDTMDAWVRWTNAHGGVSGHPVEAYYADDKADPAVGLAAVKDLVENKKVIALVGTFAGSTQQTWASYMAEQKVPVVGGSLIDATWFTNPMFFPMGGSVIADIWGQMKSAAVAGATKVGIVLCTEAAACAQAAPLFTNNAKSVGLEVVYNALASNTQASYTAECLKAKNAGATFMASFVNTVVFARDCARQDYHPSWINADLLPTRQTIKQVPEFENVVGASAQWPCLDQSIPATKDLFAALEQYHPNWTPGGKDYDTFADVICAAWAGGVGFAKAISNSGVTPDAVVTSADVIRGLSMFKDEDLGGITPGITLGDGTAPNPEQKCTFLYTWKDGEFAATPGPGGHLYTCRDN